MLVSYRSSGCNTEGLTGGKEEEWRGEEAVVGLNGAKRGDGDRNGSGEGDNWVQGQKKEKKEIKQWWIWVKRSEIAGKGRVLPVGFSALYPLCFRSNLYTVQGHQCVTGRLIVLQSDGGRRKNVKSSGNKEKGRSIPRGVLRWTFAEKHFQYVLYSHNVTSHNF